MRRYLQISAQLAFPPYSQYCLQMAELDQLFDSFTCIVCYHEYSDQRLPLVICNNSHFVCTHCLSAIKFNSQPLDNSEQEDQLITCPICKSMQYEEAILNFRKMLQVKDAVIKIKAREEKYKKQIEVEMEDKKLLRMEVEKAKRDNIIFEGMSKFKTLELKKMKSDLEKATNRKYPNFLFCIEQIAQTTQRSPFKRINDEISQLKKQNNELTEEKVKLIKDLAFSHQFIKKMAINLMSLQEIQNNAIEAWKDKPLNFQKIQEIIHNFQLTFKSLKKKPSLKSIPVKQSELRAPKNQQEDLIKQRAYTLINNQNKRLNKDFFNLTNGEKSEKKLPSWVQKNDDCLFESKTNTVKGVPFQQMFAKPLWKNQASANSYKKTHDKPKYDSLFCEFSSKMNTKKI